MIAEWLRLQRSFWIKMYFKTDQIQNDNLIQNSFHIEFAHSIVSFDKFSSNSKSRFLQTNLLESTFSLCNPIKVGTNCSQGKYQVSLIKSKLVISLLLQMKKQIGIVRNRFDRLAQIKKEAQRKKNRFQMVGKEEQEDNNMFSLTTTNSDPVSFAELAEEGEQSTLRAVQLFKEARTKMSKVGELQKKMGQISKQRLTCLRQKQNEKYDESVSKLAGEATKFILTAQGLMRQISNIEVNSATSKKKVLKSMQAALAGQVQQASRNLRNQQQEYFKRIKAYEMTTNSAIQLTAEQRKSMEGEWELVQEKQQDKQNSKISELVNSISKLSAVYKELGQLVVTQGTVIDRIDYNLQQTEQHTAKAVVHLTNADAEVSSPFADKVIKSLVGAIILLAIILALKYMN